MALRRTADDPVLRRLQLGLTFFSLAEYGGWLVLLVYAFDRGGTTEAGLVAFATMLPGVVAAPLAGYVGDRFRPDRALPVGYLVQAVAFAATAAAKWSGRRDDFLEAVTGHPRCMDVATEVADRHVARWPETWQP